RRDRIRAEEKEKRRSLNEQHAAEAFREYHTLKPSQSRGHVVVKYIEARGGVVNADNYKKGLADLNDPAFLKLYCPDKAARMENFAIAKAWAADVKPIYVAKCKFCRIVFLTNEEFAEHQRTTKPCPKCKAVCSSG